MKKTILNFFLALLLISGVSDAQQVSIGSDTKLSVFSPICRTKDYCVYEIIYLSSEINTAGLITDFGFYRFDGTNTDSIHNVSVFMKQTSASQLSTGTYSENGYQLVYQGAWPNDAGSGWREVTLDTPFNYDGISNLQVLTVKGYEPAIANTPVTPRWYYTDNATGSNRARRYYDNVMIDTTTTLATINYNSNARLTFGTVGISKVIGDEYSVFPNPASSEIFVHTNAGLQSGSVFELRDLNARLIRNEMLKGDNRISVLGLAPGIYICTIYSGNRLYKSKLVID